MTVTYKVNDKEMEQQAKEELRAAYRALGIEETLEYIREHGDLFVLEDEDVSQSIAHLATLKYLVPILEWLFEGQDIAVAEDFRLYVPGDENSKVAPDIALIEGLVIDTSSSQKSYGVGLDGPPPLVVFEIASESTWDKDVLVANKLGKYERMGVKEYFACDPNPEQFWEGEWLARGRLIGWRLNPQTHTYTELKKDRQGRFKSEQLNSFLKMETVGNYSHWLRLYDLEGNLRLDKADAEYQRAETEYQRAEVEHQRADAERQRAEAEHQRADTEHQRVQELEALVRQLKNQA